MAMYVSVFLASLVVAGLTFFSGFGLGTLLMPLFALFFPLPVAVAATAVVHFANNLFKIALVGRNARWGIVLRFGLPAALAAVAGAWLLGRLALSEPIAVYTLFGAEHAVAPVKLVIGTLMVLFAVFELVPALDRLSMPPSLIPLGGVLSGFFGGLSGHQGALRTIFLIRAGLDTTAFVATIAVVAGMVDVVRLTVYGLTFLGGHFAAIGSGWGLVAAACLGALAGSISGRMLLKKITMRQVRFIVGTLLLLLGTGLASGLV